MNVYSNGQKRKKKKRMRTYLLTYICKKQTPPPLHARTRVHVSHHSVAIHVICCMYVCTYGVDGAPGWGDTHSANAEEFP